MSVNFLQLIPVEPTFVPNPAAQQEAKDLLTSLAPDSDEITAETTDDVQFIDAGSNFETISCPTCGQELTVEWWQAAMNEAYEAKFQDLHTISPCCGAELSLNDLNYTRPQGFAKFVLQARNPNVAELDKAAVVKMEEAVGCSLRTIWTHY